MAINRRVPGRDQAAEIMMTQLNVQEVSIRMELAFRDEDLDH